MSLSPQKKAEIIKSNPELRNWIEKNEMNDILFDILSSLSALKGEKVTCEKIGLMTKEQKAKIIAENPELRDWLELRDTNAILKPFAENIGNLKGEKGDDGDKGLDGKDGVNGKDGINGKDGRDGLDGRNGRDGKDGIDGKDGKDGSPDSAEQIAIKLNTLEEAIDVSVIKGAVSKEDFEKSGKKIDEISNTINTKGKIDQRWHGGGLSKVTTDSTLTGNGTPASPLHVASAGGVTQITAGTNVTISPSGGTGNVTINATGGGTPGGSPTQLQYNASGAFAGIPGSSVTNVQPGVGATSNLTAPQVTYTVGNVTSGGTFTQSNIIFTFGTSMTATVSSGAQYNDTNGNVYTAYSNQFSTSVSFYGTAYQNGYTSPYPPTGTLNLISGSGDALITYTSVSTSSSNPFLGAYGNYWQFSISPYVYTESFEMVCAGTPYLITGTDDGSSNSCEINLSWTNPGGIAGVLLTVVQDDFAGIYNMSLDIGNVSSISYTGLLEMLAQGSSISPTNLSPYTTAGKAEVFNGDASVTGSVIVGDKVISSSNNWSVNPNGDIKTIGRINLNGGVENNGFSLWQSYAVPNQYFNIGLGNTLGNPLGDKEFVFGGGTNPGLSFYDYVNGGTFQIGGHVDYGQYNGGTFRVYSTGVSLYDVSGGALRVNNGQVTTQNNTLDDGSGNLTAATLKKSGGSPSQILAADGSVITAGTNITISGGTISASGGGGGAVSSVSNSDSTLTISPTTGSVVASLNLGHANTWTGAQTFTANLSIDVTGSNTTTPRILGLTNLMSGTAARFQFGDVYNSIQTNFGGRQIWQGYWGIEIHGSRQTVGSSVSFATGGATDPNVNIINDASDVVGLAVSAYSSQTQNIQEWRNSSGTALANVSSSGVVQGAGYKSSDGSAGITTTVTTASLVGKTITIKNGIITSFS